MFFRTSKPDGSETRKPPQFISTPQGTFPFFGRFKTSTVRKTVFADESELRATVFEYIEIFYNRFRKHSSLGYISPVDFEENCAPPMGGNVQAQAFTNN